MYKRRTPLIYVLLLLSVLTSALCQAQANVPLPPEDPEPTVPAELFGEEPSTAPTPKWLAHPERAVEFPGEEPRITRVITLPEARPLSSSDEQSPPQNFEPEPDQSPRFTPPDHVPNGAKPEALPEVEDASGSGNFEKSGRFGSGGGLKAVHNPGDHMREFEGEGDHGSYPPDTDVAVGSQHIVEVVNRGLTVFNKLGTEVQGYRSFNDFFSASGWSLFDPKIVWSPFHNKFAMLVLARDTGAQTSRFYVAISKSTNALGDWWWWSFNAESLGDSGNWIDFASIGGDPFGIYVVGNLYAWENGAGLTKLWAISPQAWNGGPANHWVWRNLEWPSGSKAKSPEVGHAHSQAWDGATFMVNTYDMSGSDALLWRIVGDRHTGAGLLLSRYVVDIDDHDAPGNVQQPGGPELHGGRSVVGNAVYANRNILFSVPTDVEGDGSSSGLLTYRVNVDSRDVEWSDLHWSGTGRYYLYPAVALRGWSPENHMAVFYSYTSVPENVHPSSGFKFFDNQPVNDDGPNQLYQSGLAVYERLDSHGRNRWGDWSGASYDWQCGHLWGATEYAGTGNKWRTRIKAVNGNGEAPCPKIGVTFPNGLDKVIAGTTYDVQWDSVNVPPNSWIVVFYDDGRTIEPISPFLSPSSRSFSWTVPEKTSSNARINVAAWDGERFVLSDWSDWEFAVVD